MRFMISVIAIVSFVFLSLSRQVPCQFDNQFSPNYQHLSKRQLLLKTRFGFHLIVDTNDKVVSRDIRNYGTWQSSIIHLIRSLVNQGDNVINLGSQSGLEALLMAFQVGQNGKVFVFEPYSFSYRIMRKSVYLNNLQHRVFTYNIGASKQYEIGKLNVAYENTGGSQIHNRQQFDAQNLQQINSKSSPIFNQIEKVVLNKVDSVVPKDILFQFALIDIEKMQIQAIDGMKQIIKRSPNLVILTEWNYGVVQDRDYRLGESVIQFLFDQGYQFYQLKTQKNCQMPSFFIKQSIKQLYLKDKNLLLLPKNMQLPNS